VGKRRKKKLEGEKKRERGEEGKYRSSKLMNLFRQLVSPFRNSAAQKWDRGKKGETREGKKKKGKEEVMTHTHHNNNNERKGKERKKKKGKKKGGRPEERGRRGEEKFKPTRRCGDYMTLTAFP